MILLYHNIIPDNSPLERYCVGQALLQSVFERQIKWLIEHYKIVSLTEYLASPCYPKRDGLKRIAITFDDGFDIAFQCIYPFIVRNAIPVTIFITTGHLERGNLLWFSYLKALCFENQYKFLEVNQATFWLNTLEQKIHGWNNLRAYAREDGDPVGFCRKLSERYPIDATVSSTYQGMTYEQIKLAVNSGLFELDAHTIIHPYLTGLSKKEQEQEIIGSKRALYALTGQPVRYFAYPGGEYDQTTLEIVNQGGYEGAFAIIPQKLGYPLFEIERIGIYSQSFLKFKLKILGVSSFARRFGLKVG